MSTTSRLVKFLLPLTLICLAAGLALAQPFDTKFTEEVAKEKAAMAFVAAKTVPADQEQKDLAQALADQTAKGGYKLMSTAELKKTMDEKKPMLVIDTMPADSFAKEHFPGAVNFVFPIPDMTAWDAKETGGQSEADFVKLLGPDKGRLLVFYCGFVKCTRSHNGAVWAKKLGYTNVVRVPGGLFAWKGQNFPMAAAK